MVRFVLFAANIIIIVTNTATSATDTHALVLQNGVFSAIISG